MQPVQRFAPESAIDQVVPLRDEVIDRTARGHPAEQSAGMAEGDPAIHTPTRLLLEFFFLHVEMELIPVADAFNGGTIQRQLAQIFDKSSRFAHLSS